MNKKNIFSPDSVWRESLAGKFVIVTVLIVMVTMGVNVFFNYHSQKKIIFENIKGEGNTLGDFIASIAPEFILSYDFDTMNEHMREITKSHDVVYAVVFAPDGEVMTNYLDQENAYISRTIAVKKNPEIKSVIEHVKAKNPEIMELQFPISFEEKILGDFHLGISKKRINAITHTKLINQLIVSAVLVVVLGAGIFVVFRRYTLKPIRQLVKGAQDVASGKLNTELEIYSGDELGHLTQSFNRMMANLKHSRQETEHALQQLQELNKNLEDRVATRTYELGDLNKKLEKLALHDSLTDLPNRFMVQEQLKQCVSSARRRAETFVVIMMDLDRFKDVNDSLGHDAGDKLLIEVGMRLSKVLRDSDLIGRLGGDEFAILLPNTDEENALVVVKKLLAILEPFFYLENLAFSISASLGVAVYPQHGEDASALLKAADVAMYYAKNHKLGYYFYNPDMDNCGFDSLNLMAELRIAIRKGQLECYYQPKVDLNSKMIVGVEALVRWRHPQRGYIPPDQFISLAEQSGLIKPITYFMIDTALRQNLEWAQMGIDVSVSINISMHNLQDADFPLQVGQMLSRLDISTDRIIFEVTESTIMSNPDYVLKVLDDLREVGVSFSIDDFGTGYSSLSQLKKLPVQELKIDKSFVMDIAEDKDDETIVISIIDMAHNLGLNVVAEGVENAEVCRLLIKFGCDMVQGYFVSSPVPAYEMTQMFQNLHWPPGAKHGSVG